jgi:hypothetical protein
MVDYKKGGIRDALKGEKSPRPNSRTRSRKLDTLSRR